MGKLPGGTEAPAGCSLGNCTAARHSSRRRAMRAMRAAAFPPAFPCRRGRHVHLLRRPHLLPPVWRQVRQPRLEARAINLGRWSKPLTALSACWLCLAIVLFVLPQVRVLAPAHSGAQRHPRAAAASRARQRQAAHCRAMPRPPTRRHLTLHELPLRPSHPRPTGLPRHLEDPQLRPLHSGCCHGAGRRCQGCHVKVRWWRWPAGPAGLAGPAAGWWLALLDRARP